MSDNNVEQPVSIGEHTEQKSTPESFPIHPTTTEQMSTKATHDKPARNINDVRNELDGIKVGIYKGQTGRESIARGRSSYEEQWNQKEGEHMTYDNIIATAIERAAVAGRDEVIMFDFGCGEGNTMKELVEDEHSEAMKSVKAHPDVKVKLIGLTDTVGLTNAPATKEDVANGKNLKSPNEEPTNLSARIDFYAVTAARTLEDYFVAHGINAIDVGMAIQSLAYLPRKNFEATVESITRRLQSPGSIFIAAPYSTQVPGFDYYGGHPRLDVRTKTDGPSVHATMHGRSMRFLGQDIDVQEEVKYLKIALQKYVGLGRITEEQIDERINSLLPRKTRASNRWHHRRPSVEQLITKAENPPVALGQIANLMDGADQEYFDARQEKLFEQKKAALTTLKEKYADTIEIAFDDNVISMRTREEKIESKQEAVL